MIILDTDVLSALMRPDPEEVVARWLDAQPPGDVWTTSITIFEVRFGIAVLPPGSRRKSLTQAFDALLGEDLKNRVVDFDADAAAEAAALAAARQAKGKPVGLRDTQIAGIALTRRAFVATRKVRHFDDAGVALLNPWGEDH